jgi:serine/threonine-protein kinase
MVHADLNPTNVLVQSGDEVRLLEVGLCSRTIFTRVDESTSAGWPMFIAPEQLQGETASARSDLRAAGVLLYRMLAGCDPFSGSSASIMQKVLTEELPPLSHVKPDMGSQFDSVLAKSTARHAERRFRSAEEFLHALNRAAFVAGAMVAVAARAPAAAGGLAMESGQQARLATALRNAVGPIAPILLEKALQESSSTEQCRAVLAAQITDAQARGTFLRATLDMPVADAAPAAERLDVAMARGAWPLHATQLQRLITRLSEEIGPMATLLVERAAARAASQEEFIARMKEVLPTPADEILNTLPLLFAPPNSVVP